MTEKTKKDSSAKKPAAKRGRASDKKTEKPVILITGAAGQVGTAIGKALEADYKLVGLELEGVEAEFETIAADLTDDISLDSALDEFRSRHGKKIAAVIHLAAYFDFTGEEHPLYEKLNVEGSRRLVRALRDFEVERFIYSGTMLIHEPGEPGDQIDERAPIKPQWAYPRSKAKAEEAISEEAGDMPLLFLHLAGLYDDTTAVPTLTEQIRRIYERDPKAHAFAGTLDAGQSFIHSEDMAALFAAAVAKRKDLPQTEVILAGESEAVSYQELQKRIANLIHGARGWPTLNLPKPFAKMAAWLDTKSEPVVPDDFDHGQKPFIRSFMIDMADDHYALDISRARALLGWEPEHSIRRTLPGMIKSLKADPAAWYEENGLTKPFWLTAAEPRKGNPDKLRAKAVREARAEHYNFIWAPLLNMAMGLWLLTSPAILGYESAAIGWSDAVAGLLVTGLSFLTLSWRFAPLRWAVAGLGVWVMSAPLLFWVPTAAAYLNGTLCGALIFGFAALVRPMPGVDPIAATTGPTVPKGWQYSPSSWFQRLPIIILACVGFFISRHLAAYQLGHIEGVFEPFFSGSAADPQNGTEEIITSSVSEAWPVSDAGVGALTYMLEILTGVVGSSRRWRTMPWLVVLFGIMIVPLGVISITFIVIQPIVIGTWCTLCLIAAAAMLIQIPYSLDELIATGQFLARRKREGRPLLRVFFTGDTDEGEDARVEDDFARPLKSIIGEMLGGGMSTPPALLASLAIAVWLMFTRLTLGTEGGLADADHLIGALVATVTVTAFAEAARPLRFLNTLLGLALVLMPFVMEATLLQTGADVLAGLALIALSLPRGRIRNTYGSWSRHIV